MAASGSPGDGRVEAVGRGAAIARAAETPMIMLNAPLIGNRLGYPDLSGLDLLELFAFVHPARFAVPTPKGLAHALGLDAPEGDEAAALFLRAAAAALLGTLAADWPEREGAWASAQALYRLRWTWAGAVAERLSRPERDERWLFSRLPEWEESGGRPQPRPIRLDLADTALRLEHLVGEDAEVRDGQRDYAAAAAAVFDPRRVEDQPNVLLAEAGHRDRQDPGLSRAGLALGGEGRRRGLDLDLHQGAAAPARPRGRAALPRRRRAQGARS